MTIFKFGFSGALGLRFALIINDFTSILRGLIGILLSIAYIYCFLYYTNNKKDKQFARTQVGYAVAFLAAVYAYSLVENPEVLRFRFGMIFTSVLFLVISHPVITLVLFVIFAEFQ